jgi:hypothetical protein
MNSGDTATVTFGARGEAAGQGTLTVEAHGAGFDPVANHSATRLLTVLPTADFSISLAESSDPVAVGANYQYVATVHSNGPDTSQFRADLFFPGLTVVSASADFGTCAINGHDVNCALSSLSAGAQGIVTVTVNGGSAGVVTASAIVNAVSSTKDPDISNNGAFADTVLELVGDLSVEIVDSADPVAVGAAFSYLATVRNAGPNAGSVSLSAPVTGGLISGATVTGGTCTFTPSLVSCTIPSLASGGSATLTINVSAGAGNLAGATA